jgi:hypothetical protein
MIAETRDRLHLSWEEILERALQEERPEELKKLLSALLLAYYPKGDAEQPRSGADFTAAFGKLAGAFHPDALGYVPDVLLKSIGVELVLWLEEGLGRPPTCTDVARLYARLSGLGLREAIHQFCLRWNSGEAVHQGGP